MLPSIYYAITARLGRYLEIISTDMYTFLYKCEQDLAPSKRFFISKIENQRKGLIDTVSAFAKGYGEAEEGLRDVIPNGRVPGE